MKIKTIYYIRGIINSLIIIFFLLFSSIALGDSIYFSDEEEIYIKQSEVIKAASINGVAPIQYLDEEGNVKGISIKVLEEISDMTGLKFDYKLYNSIEEIKNQDYSLGIVFGLPEIYLFEDLTYTKSYLNVETNLYINDKVDIKTYENGTYAGVEGGDLPAGVKLENVIYFPTREDSIDAVNRAIADYGYGNAYSISYYILKNKYKNLVTIPKGADIRTYSIGVAKEDKLLISILNKAIGQLKEDNIKNLIFEVPSDIDRKITPRVLIEDYSMEVVLAFSVIMVVLLFNIIIAIKSRNNLRLKNERYLALSNIGNEYIFEYNAKSKKLKLPEKTYELLNNKYNVELIEDRMRVFLDNAYIIEPSSIMEIPLKDGSIRYFKILNSKVYDHMGKVDTIIGKFSDITEEYEERKQLKSKSERDGLTGLYNSETTKKLITERLLTKNEEETDILILVDCDKFKLVNDNLGHLKGDEILAKVGSNMSQSFRNTDIIGRVGGDEFCIYVKNIKGFDFIYNKCIDLNKNIYEKHGDLVISLSMGMYIIENEKTYEAAMEKADIALYEAKKAKTGRIRVYK